MPAAICGKAVSLAAAALRELLQRVIVVPTPRGQPLELEIVGNLAPLLFTERNENRVPSSVVAGVGFEPTTIRL